MIVACSQRVYARSRHSREKKSTPYLKNSFRLWPFVLFIPCSTFVEASHFQVWQGFCNHWSTICTQEGGCHSLQAKFTLQISAAFMHSCSISLLSKLISKSIFVATFEHGPLMKRIFLPIRTFTYTPPNLGLGRFRYGNFSLRQGASSGQLGQV